MVTSTGGLTDGWRSLHIFLDNTTRLEAFLIEQIGPRLPAIRASCSAWFFIRYWEGGQHIRLRLRNPERDAFEVFRSQLSSAIDEYRSAAPMARETYLAALSRPLLASAVGDATVFYDDGTVIELPYVAEVERYGGPDALPNSEMLFGASSDIALSVIAGTQSRPTVRLGVVRDFMIAGAAAWTRDRDSLRVFFAKYAAFWRSLAGDVPDDAALRSAAEKSRAAIAARLNALETSKDAFSAWYSEMQKFVAVHRRLAVEGRLQLIPGRVSMPADSDATISSIVSSHIHMTNNRFGTGPANEYAMASVIANAL